MRHRVFGKKLSRSRGHRRSLFKNLARSFFIHGGKIKTTLAKAKAVRPLIERMIAKAGRGDLNSRRWLFKYFQDQNLVNQIVETFGKQFEKRKGGYTRVVKIKKRKGDDAVIVSLELVEEFRPKDEKQEEEKKKKKTRKTEVKEKK